MARLTVRGRSGMISALTAIERRVATSATLKAGFPEDAKYPDGQLVAMVAAVQNFGAPAKSIPPRPFFSSFAEKFMPHAEADFAELLEANNLDARLALGQLGEIWVAGIQEELITMEAPKLSKITVMLRKMRSTGGENFVVTGATVGEAARRVAEGESTAGISDKPLIYTGNMLRSVTYWVGA